MHVSDTYNTKILIENLSRHINAFRKLTLRHLMPLMFIKTSLGNIKFIIKCRRGRITMLDCY